jgi:hypothetical protein
MSSEELSRWLAYDQIDHIPDPIHIGAMICSVMANVMSTGKRKFTPDDFTGRRLPKPKIVSGEAGNAFFRGVFKAHEIATKNKEKLG